MTAKLKTRRNRDYGPLKSALTKHIESLSFDHEFYVADLVHIAKANGYTEEHLPFAMSSLTRTGIVERVGRHKRDYQTIIHYCRARAPKPKKEKQPKNYQATIDARAKQMNDASMRLWRALGMPVVSERSGRPVIHQAA